MESTGTAGKLNHLAIAVDLSSSMRDFKFAGAETRLDWILRQVDLVLREAQAPIVVRLYAFHDALVCVGEYHELDAALVAVAGLRDEPGGGSTNLWDSLAELIAGIPGPGPWSIICATDADDTGSQNTRQSVESALTKAKGSTLTIVDLSGGNGGASSTQPIDDARPARVVDATGDPDAAADMLLSAMKAPCSDVTSLDISVSVIPLYDCSESAVKTVCDAIRRAVPHLERLTGLRYYPVPTYLVNSEQMQKLSPSREVPTPVGCDDDIEQNALELIRFIRGVALAFHVRGLRPAVLTGEDDYGRFSELPPDSLMKLRAFGEVAGDCLTALLEGRNGPQDECRRVPELPGSDRALSSSEANLTEIHAILKRLSESYPAQIWLTDEYFYEGGTRSGTGMGGRPAPDLGKWRKVVTPDDMAVVERAVEGDPAAWTLKLEDMVSVLAIAIKALFPLIAGLILTNLGLATLRTMGLYSPPGNDMEAGILTAAGRHLAVGQGIAGGRAFIDVEGAARKTASSPAGGELADKAIASVVVHEHAHAAAREGLPFTGGSPTNNWPKLPSETLAEWAELEFFRGDPDMFEAVLLHAASGKLPDWPYAGAVPFVTKRTRDERRPYRKLLGLLRTDPDAAVRKVLSMQRS